MLAPDTVPGAQGPPVTGVIGVIHVHFLKCFPVLSSYVCGSHISGVIYTWFKISHQHRKRESEMRVERNHVTSFFLHFLNFSSWLGVPGSQTHSIIICVTCCADEKLG